MIRFITITTLVAASLALAIPAVAQAPSCARAHPAHSVVVLDHVSVDVTWTDGAHWQTDGHPVRVAARLTDGTTVRAIGATGSIPGATLLKICIATGEDKPSTSTTLPESSEKPATTTTTAMAQDKHATTTTVATMLTSSTSMVSTTTSTVAVAPGPDEPTTPTEVVAQPAPTPPTVPATVPVTAPAAPAVPAKPDEVAASSRWISQQAGPVDRPTIRVRPAAAQAPITPNPSPAIQVLPAQLPQTGVDWTPYAITGVALVLLGGLAVARSRRATVTIL